MIRKSRGIFFFILTVMLLFQPLPVCAKINEAKILNIIEKNYVEEVNQENLYEKALNKIRSYSPESTTINKFGLNAYNVICSGNNFEFQISNGDIKNYNRFSEIFKKCTTKADFNKHGYDIDQMAMNTLLVSLDPHSSFLPADMFKELAIDTRGNFGGIGIEITMKKDMLTIVSPIEDTPAFQAGIKAGDQIIMVDGQSTNGITVQEAVKKLRGKVNSKVTVTIVREGFAKPKDFVLNREVIKIKSVKAKVLANHIGFIRLSAFMEMTREDLKRAIQDLEATANPMKGLILDLRNNPGGLLNQAVEVSDIFLKSGTIVSTRGRTKDMESKNFAKNNNDEFTGPIVIIVNEGTASAAEIVSGALQDNGRALIIGTQTFGKGSVQTIIPLEDGSALKLTTAKYYRPKGQVVQDIGITPNVIIGKTQGFREKDIPSVNKFDFSKTDPMSKDESVHDSERQLQEGIRLLEMVIAVKDMAKGLQDYQQIAIATPSVAVEAPQKNTQVDRAIYISRLSVFNFNAITIDASKYGPEVTNMITDALGKNKAFSIIGHHDLLDFLRLNDLQQNNDLGNLVNIGSRLGLNFIVTGRIEKKGMILAIECIVVDVHNEKIIFTRKVQASGDSNMATEVSKMSDSITTAIAARTR
jgi:C-terminal peptidase prc